MVFCILFIFFFPPTIDASLLASDDWVHFQSFKKNCQGDNKNCAAHANSNNACPQCPLRRFLDEKANPG
jgi:hypothetical protein